MKNVYRVVCVIVLVIVVAYLTPGNATGQGIQQPTHQALLAAITLLQSTLATIQNTLATIQDAITNLSSSVNAPPPWSQSLPAAQRFELALGGSAVLDRETNLVWQRVASLVEQDVSGAMFACNNKLTGGRRGWKLPTVQELASLVDPSGGLPKLPAGNPFSHVQSSWYWSASIALDNAFDSNWAVNFQDGSTNSATRTDPLFVWCVRGGQGVNPQ